MPGVNRYYIIITYTQVENVNAKLKCRNYTYPYLNVYRKLTIEQHELHRKAVFTVFRLLTDFVCYLNMSFDFPFVRLFGVINVL